MTVRIICHDCERELARASKKRTALARAFTNKSAEGHICTDGVIRCETCFRDWLRELTAAVDAKRAEHSDG